MTAPESFKVGQVWEACDGSLRKIVCNDAHGRYPVVSVAVDPVSEWPVTTHTTTGNVNSSGVKHRCDLVREYREPMKLPMWVVQFDDGTKSPTLYEHEALAKVRRHGGRAVVGTWTEGRP